MNYLAAIIVMEVSGLLSIFFFLVIVQAFLRNEDMGEFLKKNIENGVFLKVLIFVFAIMGIVLTYYGFMNVRW